MPCTTFAVSHCWCAERKKIAVKVSQIEWDTENETMRLARCSDTTSQMSVNFNLAFDSTHQTRIRPRLNLRSCCCCCVWMKGRPCLPSIPWHCMACDGECGALAGATKNDLKIILVIVRCFGKHFFLCINSFPCCLVHIFLWRINLNTFNAEHTKSRNNRKNTRLYICTHGAMMENGLGIIEFGVVVARRARDKTQQDKQKKYRKWISIRAWLRDGWSSEHENDF